MEDKTVIITKCRFCNNGPDEPCHCDNEYAAMIDDSDEFWEDGIKKEGY